MQKTEKPSLYVVSFILNTLLLVEEEIKFYIFEQEKDKEIIKGIPTEESAEIMKLYAITNDEEAIHLFSDVQLALQNCASLIYIQAGWTVQRLLWNKRAIDAAHEYMGKWPINRLSKNEKLEADIRDYLEVFLMCLMYTAYELAYYAAINKIDDILKISFQDIDDWTKDVGKLYASTNDTVFLLAHLAVYIADSHQ